MKYLKLKFLLIFAALAMAIPPAWARQVTDVITANDLTATGTSYKEFSGLQKSSPAVYQGITARKSATGPMQWNNKNNCGIVSTTSGGTIVSVTIEWDNSTLASRVMNIYGSNTAYTSSSDLYGDNKGTKIEALTYDANNLTQTATFPNTTDYKYVGIVPSNAQYINSITIVWEVPDTGAPYIEVDPEDGLTINDATGDNVAKTGTLTATLTNGQGDLTATTSSSVWSWNNNTATFAGYSYDNGNKIYLPLHDKATVTFSSTGATDVTANLEYNYTGPLYILGTVNGWTGWGANNAVEIAEPDANGIYTVTLTTTAGEANKSWISFSKRIAENNDEGGWAYIAPYRFSLLGDDVNTAYWLTEDKIGEWIDLDFDPSHAGNQPLRMDAGTYDITIDAKNNRFKIERHEVPVSKVYNKVIDESQLIAGKNYILVNEKNAKFMGQIDGYGNAESGPTITEGSVDISSNKNITELTLSGDENGWSFYNGEGYISWPTGNALSVDDEIDDYSKWTVSYFESDTKGSGFILTNVYDANRVLQYNNASPRFACYTGSQLSAVLYVQDGVEPVIVPTVATPTFNPAGGTYTEVQNVEILCATDGATIYYTTDGTDPTTASAVYNAAIPVNETKTIKAMAVKDGMENSAIAEATYTINLPITVSTLAAANALEDETRFTFTEKDVVVTFKQSYTTNNGNTTHTLIGLRDKSENDKTDGTGKGGSVFYNISSSIADGLIQGTVLNPGWKAKVDIYNGWSQLVGASNVNTQADLVTVDPFDRTGVTLTKDNQSEYIKLNNVTISGTTATAGGSKANYILFDRFDLKYKDGNYKYLIGVVNYYKNDNTNTENVTIYPLELKEVEKVATPTFDPEGGEYTTIQNVTIATTTEGATISYKIGENGEWKTYENPIEVAESCTIYAKATKTGMDDSDEANATYTINLPTLAAPTFSPEAGTYDEAQTVTISAAEGAAISYKIGEDGEWTTYTKAIPVSENCTIYAKATKKGFIDSPEASAEYKFRQEATLSFGDETAFTVYPEEDFEAPTLTKTPADLAPIVYSIEGNDPEIVLFDEEDGTVIIGEKTGTVTITAAFEGNDDYMPASASYTITVEPRPYVTAVPASLDFVTVIGEEPVSKTFTVMAENLKEGITLTLSETEVFTINPATIAKADMTEDGVEVTVTYNPTAATGEDFDEAKITIKSKDAEDVTVTLTGMATLPDPELTVSTDALEMGTNPTGTFTVTGQNLTEDVTVSIKEGSDAGFSVAPTTIEATNGAIENATVTVTYSGTSTTDAYATVVVKSGTASKEVFVSAHVLPTPVIEIDEGTLDLGTTGEGSFYLMATDLRGNITLSCENENFTVSPTTITPEEAEEGVTITVTYTGNNTQGETATINITTDGIDEPITKVVTAKAETYVDIAKPTFSPAAGTYTEPKEVAIACATPGVTIMYSINGGTPQAYTKPFMVENSCTVTATATMGTRTSYTPATSEAAYTINKVAAAAIADDYYYMQNNELSSQYANVAGRRTLNFVADTVQQAGTVFRVETGEGGAVKTLRSQAVDLQGYANRAMAYVPKAIELVLSTLANSSLGDPETPGTGILGENGVDLILKKFYENIDTTLYIEQANGGYRIYGRTPSMQHVVDFYHENTAQVEEKLPKLETYINQVLEKIKNKIPAPYDANVVIPFSLKAVRDRIAEKNGITLIDPTVDEMGFYRQVLNNKEYVWDFAYQTAMMYVDVIKQTGTYQSLDPEYKRFVDKMQNIRPETKYYMIQYGNEPDYVSENNVKIIGNDPSTFWTLTKRENFTVNVPAANELNGSYYTTLYTDFAYELPEGVNAYAVTGIDANKVAELTEITGTIPAQTPVLLKADAAGDKLLTIKKESRGGAIEGNLLEGPDYLINKYQFEAPTVANLFTMAESFVPADVLADYEYLKLRNSGTVNNKYFWNVNSDLGDIEGVNVLRSLSTSTGVLAFSDDSKTEDNKAFMVSETEPVIYLSIDTVATPTLSLVPGSYTGKQTLSISCATDDATIWYSTDGGNTWTEGTSVTLTEDCTVMVKAEKEGMIPSKVVTAEYIIDMPAEVTTITPFKGYYQIKNNENNKYANVAGRRTLNFLSENDAMSNAGTIFYLETNDSCKVLSLRSQGVDLQGYANRAMHYVPDMVQLVVNTLHAEGAGSDYILGENGLDEIMAKFNECFDYHLYVEPVGDSWRIYGKTPSMQHVVDFYREHTAQVEAKLPMLEDFINNALTKLRNKIGGETVFTPFSLHQIWENMGGTLTEPTDDASTMAFYREVLNNKNYVWDFAYQTAQIYWNNVKGHPRYEDLKVRLGEYADYIDEFVNQVRPDFKYYIIQRGDEPDYISEGNAEINDARSLWTLEPRETFKLSSAGELFGCPLATTGVGGYFTTNYTDFAYTLPEGVTAYKVTDVDADGEAVLESLSGTIPAQTPVLLVAEEDGAYEVTLSTEAGTAVSGNLLQGPDYLITLYQFKTPMVVDLFTFAQGILGQTLYDTYVAPYEYLQLRYSGTVNNKYFWNVNSDIENITGTNVIRSLSTETGELAFSDNTKTENNKAFMVSENLDVIKLPGTLRYDVNHDGMVNIKDATDLIDRLLDEPGPACPYCSDVNEDNAVNIYDVTFLIDRVLLDNPTSTTEPNEGE